MTCIKLNASIRLALLLSSLMISALFAPALSAKSITQFTKSMRLIPGFFDLYVDDKTAKSYLKIESFSEDFIFATSLPYGLGSNDIGLDRGLQGGSRLVYWHRVGDTIFLVEKNTQYRSSDQSKAAQQAVKEAFAESRLANFEIQASEGDATLIDVTSLATRDWMGVANRIEQTKQGNFRLSSSLSSLDLDVQKSFPKNTEIQAVLTFEGDKAGEYLRSVAPDSDRFTLRQRVSLIALPEPGYTPRRFHPMSGMWAQGFEDVSAPLNQSTTQRFIPRHRLKRKPSTDTLSPAYEPIVYYVDAGAPEPIRSALVEGASWWNQAFEAAGYKDAFQVKLLPDTIDPMDIRYNVILWVHRATRGWSYGSSVTDPRTFEILKGHVTLGSLRVRQDLLIAQGLTAPFANGDDISLETEMALARIRQLAAHEVGHTLGIAHNFASSAQGDASVMDYPHPKFKLNENKVSLKNAYSVNIGQWDKQVIKYAYSDFTESEELEGLASVIAENKQLGLSFISDSDARPVGGAHPTAHLWDNGSDAVEELTRLLELREHALTNFSAHVIPDGTPYSELQERLVLVYNLHRYQVEAVAKLIGGLDYNYAVKGESSLVLKSVDKNQQQAALSQLIKTLSPQFLKLDDSIIQQIPPKAYGYQQTRESFESNTGLTLDPYSIAQAAAAHTLNYLLNEQRLTRLAQQSVSDNLSAAQLLNELTGSIIKPIYSDRAEQLIQMRVAQSYISRLLQLSKGTISAVETNAVVQSELAKLEQWLKQAIGRTRISDTRYGYLKVIETMLENPDDVRVQFKEPKLPPGSPIG
ncbi:MAG: zinc-dependent metalloprotease [Gammaproteobacteria bacterium]|nr:zinc-dependent metalloprotease [Gammaproteobacteria bacterium]